MSANVVHNPDELLPTRRSLIERLRDLDDQGAWREFFELYWKLIYGAAIRAGLTDQEAEDAVQETVIGVARKMETFRYDPSICSFKGWLMHVTRRRITDQFRRRRAKHVIFPSSGPNTAAEELSAELDHKMIPLESIWEEEWQKNIMDAAMQRVRRSVKAEHYQIFHLHVVKGLDVREVAKLTGSGLAKVYVTSLRISQRVKVEVRRLEKLECYA